LYSRSSPCRIFSSSSISSSSNSLSEEPDESSFLSEIGFVDISSLLDVCFACLATGFSEEILEVVDSVSDLFVELLSDVLESLFNSTGTDFLRLPSLQF